MKLTRHAGLDLLLADLQATWPLLSDEDLCMLGLRALRTLSGRTHDHTVAPTFTQEELEREEWRPLQDFTSCAVSNLGNIRGGIQNASKRRKISQQTGGYAVVRLRGVNGFTQVLVGREVARAFFRAPAEGEVLNHLNGNKLDNRVTNLEWTSQRSNIRHSNEKGLRMRASRNMLALALTTIAEVQSFHRKVPKAIIAKIYGLKSSEVSEITERHLPQP